MYNKIRRSPAYRITEKVLEGMIKTFCFLCVLAFPFAVTAVIYITSL